MAVADGAEILYRDVREITRISISPVMAIVPGTVVEIRWYAAVCVFTSQATKEPC